MIKVYALRRCGRAKRGLLGAPKMDFMKLRNESTLWLLRWRFPQRSPIDPNGPWRVGLSNSKHVHRNVQSCIRTCSPALWHWCSSPPPQDLPRSDSIVWPLTHVKHLALCWVHPPKVRIVQYRDSGLRHSPPWMKNQRGSMRKATLIG